MITKAELEKMVELESEKYAEEKLPPVLQTEYHLIQHENSFKSGASFVTGILMHEIERLKEENNVRNIPLFKIEIDRLQKELSEAKETIEYLKSGVHTCHDQCPKPICVKLRDKDATIQSLKDENGRIDQQRELLEKALVRVLSQPFKGDWDVQAVYIQHMLHEARNWKALTQKAEE